LGLLSKAIQLVDATLKAARPAQVQGDRENAEQDEDGDDRENRHGGIASIRYLAVEIASLSSSALAPWLGCLDNEEVPMLDPRVRTTLLEYQRTSPQKRRDAQSDDCRTAA
jgi:hypothetical protein